MIAVYLADIRKLSEGKDRLLEMLLPERRIKALRYRLEADLLRCIAGGLLMQKILGIKTDEELVKNPYGKPALKNGGKQFNLSHSGDYVALAVDVQPVGVDIERIKNADPAVAQRCFQKAELAYVFEDNEIADERFFSIWTLKESLMKATGLGLQLAPESFCVLPYGNVMRDGREWCFKQYKPDKNHIISLCAARDDFAPDLKEIEL